MAEVLTQRAGVGFEEVHGFLQSVFGEDVHAKRVLSLANAVVGVITSASLAVHAIGQGLAHARGLLSKHAIKQVDRLLSNRQVDVWQYFAHWVPFLVAERAAIRVALDWTDFAADGHSTLALNLLTDHGRATPLLWKTVRTDQLKHARSLHEWELLVRLQHTLPPGVQVTVIADRGFFDTQLLEFLAVRLGFGYLIRMRGNIRVTSQGGECKPARAWVGAGGKARLLRGATVTGWHYPVPTVVCVQAQGMKAPWCLVSSDPAATSAALTAYYAKRWGVECHFRDTKVERLGLGLESTRTTTPERRDRLLLLSALAIALMTLLGRAGESLGYDRLLRANTVQRRTHSLFRQGLMLYELIPTMPELRLRPLMQRFGEILLAHRAMRVVFGYV